MTPTDPTRPLPTGAALIKPCPWCGAEGYDRVYFDADGVARHDTCGNDVRSETIQRVLAWTERAALPPAALREALDVERLREAMYDANSRCSGPPGECCSPSTHADAEAIAAEYNARAALSPAPAPTPVDPPMDDLGAAWAEAEAALPEGWALVRVEGRGSDWQAAAQPQPAYRHVWGHGVPNSTWLGIGTRGESPAAALRALAARLAATKAGSS